MKKYIAFATVAMMMAAVGCQKMNDIQTEDQNMNVEFTVADKPSFGADTKAVKTSWAVGDKIAIALKPSGASKVLYDYKLIGKNTRIYNCTALTLEFTESGWIANSLITPPEGFGTYYAIHHRGTVAMTLESEPTNTFNLTGYNGGELMSYTGSYIADNNGIIKLGDITMALDSRLMQISVADELNGGNLFLSQGYNEFDMTCEIPDPEKTVTMSIYQDWETGVSPTTALKGYVALCKGIVSLDFSKTDLFIYSSSADATGATPVINNYDEYDFDYSFCFANTAKVLFPPTSYTFVINRTAAAEAKYTIHTDEDEVYRTIEYDSSNRKLASGKAVKLPTNEWSAR